MYLLNITMDPYQQRLKEIFEHTVTGKTVVEIGPAGGYVTHPLMMLNPEHITIVEPDKRWYGDSDTQPWPTYVKSPPPNSTLHWCTYEKYCKQFSNTVDTVICFGILYHLHSPIQFLELIVNHNKPKWLWIEPVYRWNSEDGNYLNYNYQVDLENIVGHYIPEEIGASGNAFSSDSDIKHVPLTLRIDGTIIDWSLEHMGYTPTIYQMPSSKQYEPLKEGVNTKVTLYERND